jgi:cytoskeletal protein RodZ
MLIAILVLLGIAGAIWYFASKQTHTPSLTAEDLAEMNRRIERDAELAAAAVEPTSSISSPSVEKIDETLASIPELPVQTVIEPAPVVEETYEISEEEFQTEVEADSTDVVSEEVGDSKLVRKKKRRYYPKKK